MSTAARSARILAKTSRPHGVASKNAERRSLGSTWRLAQPSSSGAATIRDSVAGDIPSCAARSPSRIGPKFEIVTRQAIELVPLGSRNSRRVLRFSCANAAANWATSTLTAVPLVQYPQRPRLEPVRPMAVLPRGSSRLIFAGGRIVLPGRSYEFSADVGSREPITGGLNSSVLDPGVRLRLLACALTTISV